MNYASLSDAQLVGLYDKLVKEKQKLEEELWNLGVKGEILKTLKPRILNLHDTESRLDHIHEILRNRPK